MKQATAWLTLLKTVSVFEEMAFKLGPEEWASGEYFKENDSTFRDPERGKSLRECSCDRSQWAPGRASWN